MPYAIAHPAAVIPLHRWLGRSSVPSALLIGSVIPDAWYFLPALTRPDTHGPSGLLLCLPLGLLVYAAFHLALKEPLLALFSPPLAAKLRACTSAGLPKAPWRAEAVSLACGVLTHLVWDSFTHEGPLSRALPWLNAELFAIHGYAVHVQQFLQHLSTLLGAAFLAWWVGRKLAATPAAAPARAACAQPAVAAILLAVPAAIFAAVLFTSVSGASPGIQELRSAVRAAGVCALGSLGGLFLAYAAVWRGLRKISG
jgi:hypothetical protein